MEGGDILEALATTIRELRTSRGWSQEQLAEHCGLHRTYVGAVERAERNITLRSLSKLAQALGTHPADLIGPVRRR